jgi:DNA-binding GntR family transcriptional regulator
LQPVVGRFSILQPWLMVFVPRSTSTTDSSRVGRARLSQAVFFQLSRAIIAGEFEPGARISEPTLSTMLSVSRAPIREALIELELRGLVEFDPTGHTRIPALTPRDIEEIHAVRLMIDPVAAGLAAEQGKPKDFAALEANIAATKSAKTLADVSRLDAEFHDRIVHATGNRRLLLCWNSLRDQFALWLTQMHLRQEAVTHRVRQDSVESHRRLLEAIRSGDAKKATEEGRRHVAGWIRLMPRIPK